MKKLIVYSRNHMDPSWRRCFTDHFYYKGEKIHPYSDIEEAQISQQFEFAEKYGWKYGIEQSISVKRFLLRNPDLKERFEKLVREGRIELLGGGECVIDYNMSCGESAYRNHYYSIRYYETAFGRRPEYADCPDTFGLSAQLPQIFRQFGYDAITQFDRVFRGHKPYWRGLDGSIVLIRPANESFDRMYGDFYKYTACGSCGGEGCEVCGGSGIDYSYTFAYSEQHEKTEGIQNHIGNMTPTEDYLKEFARSDDETRFMYVISEETLHMPDFPEYLRDTAAKYDIGVCYFGFGELVEYLSGDKIRAVREGTVPADEVDSRAEGNPMACGCYVSRIEIKKKNRMLEQLVLTAEKMAVIGLAPGEYPHKKFERMWNTLAFIQFHDCITASHTDASYAELMNCCHEVYLAASQVIRESSDAAAKKISAAPAEGFTPFAVFNPTSAEWNDLPVKTVLRGKSPEYAEIRDSSNKQVPVVSCKVSKNVLDTALEIEFIGRIPPMGHAVFYRKFCVKPETALSDGDFIENEYYRVTRQNIYDLTLNCELLCGSPGSLLLSNDWGHPWGRLQPEKNIVKLCESEQKTVTGSGYRSLILKGGYSSAEYDVEKLEWTTEITLYDGIKKIFYKNDLFWQGKNCRLTVDFPLSFDSGQTAFYEIPYGTLERGNEIISGDQLGIEDEWPQMNWFAAYDGIRDCSVVLFNKGLPGCRVKNNHMQISLLRSPTVEEFACAGAVDHGRHISEFAVTTTAGRPECAAPAAFGLRYNTVTPAAGVSAKSASLPAVHSYFENTAANVIVTAVKRSENGDMILRAYESEGKDTTDTIPAAAETDPLERKILRGPAKEHHYRPYEIKTLLISR